MTITMAGSDKAATGPTATAQTTVLSSHDHGHRAPACVGIDSVTRPSVATMTCYTDEGSEPGDRRPQSPPVASTGALSLAQGGPRAGSADRRPAGLRPPSVDGAAAADGSVRCSPLSDHRSAAVGAGDASNPRPHRGIVRRSSAHSGRIARRRIPPASARPACLGGRSTRCVILLSGSPTAGSTRPFSTSCPTTS